MNAVAEAVSLDDLRAAADTIKAAEAVLKRKVRAADANGIPRTRIADAIGRHRETVRVWCDEQGEQA